MVHNATGSNPKTAFPLHALPASPLCTSKYDDYQHACERLRNGDRQVLHPKSVLEQWRPRVWGSSEDLARVPLLSKEQARASDSPPSSETEFNTAKRCVKACNGCNREEQYRDRKLGNEGIRLGQRKGQRLFETRREEGEEGSGNTAD